MAFWTAAAIIGSSLIGGINSKNQANKQADAANDQREKQFEYDNELYAMGTDKLKADYAFAYETYELRKRNEEKLAKYTDASNEKRYNYDLKIVKAQNEANQKAFKKSEFLYGQQLDFNRRAAGDAAEEALIKQREINTEAAFANEDAVIKSIEAQGQLANTVGQGRSGQKAAQSLVAAKGRNEAMLIESLVSANRSTYMTLKSISRDKYGADLAAFANKMLEPGVVPNPLKPIPTPIADFQPPRALEEYDFGPEPIKGAKAVGGSWLSVAASAVSGVAGAAKAGAITGKGW